jgi:hypothetical protein
VYGAIVSEPSGAPSSRNVTAAIRPERAVALAFSVVGRATVRGAPISPTEGPPDEALERKAPDARECDGSLRPFWRTIARVTTAAATRHTSATAATLAPRDETQRGAENI